MSQEGISDVLDQLSRYATEHFWTEECLLEAKGYSGLCEQERSHREYLVRLHDLLMASSLHALDTREVYQFALEWWQRHILEEDMAYRQHFEGAEPGN